MLQSYKINLKHKEKRSFFRKEMVNFRKNRERNEDY